MRRSDPLRIAFLARTGTMVGSVARFLTTIMVLAFLADAHGQASKYLPFPEDLTRSRLGWRCKDLAAIQVLDVSASGKREKTPEDRENIRRVMALENAVFGRKMHNTSVPVTPEDVRVLMLIERKLLASGGLANLSQALTFERGMLVLAATLSVDPEVSDEERRSLHDDILNVVCERWKHFLEIAQEDGFLDVSFKVTDATDALRLCEDLIASWRKPRLEIEPATIPGLCLGVYFWDVSSTEQSGFLLMKHIEALLALETLEVGYAIREACGEWPLEIPSLKECVATVSGNLRLCVLPKLWSNLMSREEAVIAVGRLVTEGRDYQANFRRHR